MIRTPQQYVESLRDGRRIYLNGERIEDITKHPQFQGHINGRALSYALYHHPKFKDLLTIEENGDRYLFTEVEEITRGAVTQSWLWRVSHGQVTSPSLWTLKALSDFFKINPAYWFNAPDDNLKEQVQAERDVQDIALRSLKLTSQGRKVILNLLKSFDQEDMYKKEENK